MFKFRSLEHADMGGIDSLRQQKIGEDMLKSVFLQKENTVDSDIFLAIDEEKGIPFDDLLNPDIEGQILLQRAIREGKIKPFTLEDTIIFEEKIHVFRFEEEGGLTMLFRAKQNVQQLILMQELKASNVDLIDDRLIEYGFSVRRILKVKKIDAKLSLSDFASIAAHVQLSVGAVDVDSYFTALGIGFNTISPSLSSNSKKGNKFDVEEYYSSRQQYESLIDAIVKYKEIKINPVVLGGTYKLV